jgi:hypothetical protein
MLMRFAKFDTMNRLIKIGFVKVGYWSIVDSKIKFVVSSHGKEKNVLYCYVSNDQVLYIGKTTRSLETRLKGYQKPGPTQRTNIRVNVKILHHLGRGLPIDIYILPDSGLLKYGDFNISIAGGLEDTLINEFKPEWNISGKTIDSRNLKHKKRANSNQKRPQDIDNNSFEVILGSAYINQGFFNVRQAYSDRFGKNQDFIRIQLGDNPDNQINGVINRTANNNQTPRILGRRPLKEWIQDNFKQEDIMVVDLISPTFIRLRTKQ